MLAKLILEEVFSALDDKVSFASIESEIVLLRLNLRLHQYDPTINGDTYTAN